MSHAWVASTCTESRILQKQDVGYARCVCRILPNDIDPEVIGSAIRFAGAIRRSDTTPISFPLSRHALVLLDSCTWETGRTSHGAAALLGMYYFHSTTQG